MLKSLGRELGRGSLAALALLLASAPLCGQTTGQISGRVEDPNAGLVVDSAVRLTNELTKQTREAKTDNTGSFLFVELVPGNYSLNIRREGFRTYEQSRIEVASGERVALPPIRLTIGDVASSVTVEADAARVQTDSSERVGLINPTQIQSTPLRGRDYMGMLKVLPGVVDDTNRDAPGGSTPQLNGGRSGNVLIALDGITSQNSGAMNGTQFQPSLDAISEMKVLLNNYQAEYGARSGGVVNVVVKSGAAQFHGTGYYYKRNETLNANNFFNNANSVNVGPDGKARRPRYRYDTFGYTVGGPLIVPGTRFNSSRSKLFFFWSHEILHTKVPSALQQVTFPTDLERKGDFSKSVFGNNGAPVIVRDPTTQAPIPGNVVPASLISPAGQKILNLFPFPTTVDSTGNRQYNALFNFVREQPRSNKILRIDYALASSTTLSARLINTYQDDYGYGQALGGATNWPQLQSGYSVRGAGAVGTLVHVFRPNLVSEFSWGINYSLEEVRANQDDVSKYTRAANGIGQNDLPQLYPAANYLDLLPTTTFSAGSGGGIVNNPASITFERRFPYFGTDSIQNYRGNIAWVRGKHSMKFGGLYEHNGRNSPHFGLITGTLDFGSSTLNPLDTGWGFSNAILGVVQQYSQANNRPVRQSRYWGLEWLVQDTGKLHRG